MINTVKNFLPQQLLAEILAYFEERRPTASFEINYMGRWGAGLESGSYGPVYILPLEQFWTKVKDRFDQIEPIFNNYNLATCYLHVWDKGSQITWHHDAHDGLDRMSATIYINEHWNRDWGGLFLYQTDDQRTGWIQPEYNVMTWFHPPLWHSVSMIGLNAPIPRLSIQCFFNRK